MKLNETVQQLVALDAEDDRLLEEIDQAEKGVRRLEQQREELKNKIRGLTGDLRQHTSGRMFMWQGCLYQIDWEGYFSKLDYTTLEAE